MNTAHKMALVLLFSLLTLSTIAQDRTKFNGEWKLNDVKSDSIGHFPLCLFGGGDRMRSRIMKIAAKADFLTVDVASESADGSLVIRQEKLAFNAKESEVTYIGKPREQSTAWWSDDGQTMTVNSVRTFGPNNETADFKVTEEWRLSNDRKSIFVKVTTSSGARVDVMRLVYDRQLAADYRF